MTDIEQRKTALALVNKLAASLAWTDENKNIICYIRELLQPSPPVATGEVNEAINWIKKNYLSEPHGDHNPFPAYLKTLIRKAQQPNATLARTIADNEKLRAEITLLHEVIAQQPRQEWRAMESAPRDGTEIICRGDDPEYVFRARFGHNNWTKDNMGYGFTVSCNPRRWIPEPPKDI